MLPPVTEDLGRYLTRSHQKPSVKTMEIQLLSRSASPKKGLGSKRGSSKTDLLANEKIDRQIKYSKIPNTKKPKA